MNKEILENPMVFGLNPENKEDMLLLQFLEELSDEEYENFMTQPEDIQKEILSDWIMYDK